MLTLVELAEKLAREDEITVLELLGIHSDELVSRFLDRVEDKLPQLREEFDDTTDHSDD